MGRRSKTGSTTTSLTDKAAVAVLTGARLNLARDLLKRNLVHVREIPNGRDFLFLGPELETHDALKAIVDAEKVTTRFLHIDYVQVDQYFLLRIVGSDSEQYAISTYFA